MNAIKFNPFPISPRFALVSSAVTKTIVTVLVPIIFASIAKLHRSKLII